MSFLLCIVLTAQAASADFFPKRVAWYAVEEKTLNQALQTLIRKISTQNKTVLYAGEAIPTPPDYYDPPVPPQVDDYYRLLTQKPRPLSLLFQDEKKNILQVIVTNNQLFVFPLRCAMHCQPDRQATRLLHLYLKQNNTIYPLYPNSIEKPPHFQATTPWAIIINNQASPNPHEETLVFDPQNNRIFYRKN